MKNKFQFLMVALTALTITLTGCGSGRVIDGSSPVQLQNAKKVSSVAIQALPSAVPVSAEVKRDFETALAKSLYEDAKFNRGNELIIKYKFSSLSEGSQMERWFMGGFGNCGEGTLIVDAVFVDASGKELGQVKSEGRIGAGFFGGSFSLALEKAAEEIAKYTAHNFKA